MFENINAAKFEELMNKLENAVVLDVRTEAELAEGSIDGHVMIDYNNHEFHELMDDLDRDKTYLVYCRSGNRSMRACMDMADEGFEKLFNLDGGIKAWNTHKGK